MAGSTVSAEIDEIRAAILAQVIRRDYLEQMLEKAKLLESAHGADHPPQPFSSIPRFGEYGISEMKVTGHAISVTSEGDSWRAVLS